MHASACDKLFEGRQNVGHEVIENQHSLAQQVKSHSVTSNV